LWQQAGATEVRVTGIPRPGDSGQPPTLTVEEFQTPQLWSQTRTAEKELVDSYHKQRLWPLNKNWVSNLGIIVTFLMLSYLLGVSLLSLVGGRQSREALSEPTEHRTDKLPAAFAFLNNILC